MNYILKTIVLLFVLSGIQSKAVAQDTLLMKNGNQILSKIMEISTSEVKYKRFDNLDGPVIIVRKFDVFGIRYQNGTKEDFSDQTSSTTTTTTPTESPIVIQKAPEAPADPKIYPSGAGYYADGRRIGLSSLNNKLLSLNDPEVTRQVRQAKAAKGAQFIGLVAIPCFVAGVGVVIVQTLKYQGSSVNKRDYTPAYALFGGGVVFLTGSTVLKISYKNHLKKAVALYNAKF